MGNPVRGLIVGVLGLGMLLGGNWVFVPKAEAEDAIYARYPTRSDVIKILERGYSALVIIGRSTSRPHDPRRVRIGYPSSDNAEALNDLRAIQISLVIDAGAYPSSRAAQYMNRIGDHVAIQAAIDSCLTSLAEKRNLLAVERPVKFSILCPTDRALAEARELAADIAQEAPHLTIELIRAR